MLKEDLLQFYIYVSINGQIRVKTKSTFILCQIKVNLKGVGLWQLNQHKTGQPQTSKQGQPQNKVNLKVKA